RVSYTEQHTLVIPGATRFRGERLHRLVSKPAFQLQERPMPESALAKKLKLKPGQRMLLVNAPEGYVQKLGPLPAASELSTEVRGKFDWVQLFVTNQAQLARQLPKVVRALKPDAVLWISFPKGTSKIQTDLTRDKGWDALGKTDLKWLTLVSVDETWSAFALRPYRPGEARQSFR